MKSAASGKSLSTVVIDRLIDIILLFSIAFVSLYGFSFFYHIGILSIGTIVLIIAVILAGLYIVINRPLLSVLLKPFFNIFVPKHLKNKIALYYDDFFTGLYMFYHDWPRFLSSIGIGIISWIPPFLLRVSACTLYWYRYRYALLRTRHTNIQPARFTPHKHIGYRNSRCGTYFPFRPSREYYLRKQWHSRCSTCS